MNAQPQHKDAHGKQWEHYTDMPVGEILRRARVHYGQSLDDVEAVLRIRAAQLGALESGKVDQLPGRVYAIGFVRAYAEYLGLDGDKMVHLFKLQSGGKTAKPELNFPVAASESKLPGIFLLGMSLAAVVLIAVLFSSFHMHRSASAVEQIPVVSAQMKAEAQAPVPKALPVPAPVPVQSGVPAAVNQTAAAPSGVAAIPGQPAARIVIAIKETTWLEIRNSSGKAIISQVLNPGDKYLVPNEQGLILATGNIGGLQFIVDGRALAPLGDTGAVARGIKLDPDLMKPGAPRAGLPQVATSAVVYQPPVQPQTQVQAASPAPQPVTPAMAQPSGTAQGQANPAWQSAILPAASAPVSATAPAQTQAQPQPPAMPTHRRHLRPEDQAYKPPSPSGSARATGGSSFSTDSWSANNGNVSGGNYPNDD
jgi:cytoskeleton protein RodZ